MILLTGGSGRLGRFLKTQLPLVAPPREELDLLNPQSLRAALERYRPEVIVHAAAYTDVAKAEQERALCWATNVEGTRFLVQEARVREIALIQISTDYVFWGDRGNYKEEDPPGPVRNYYALSKLVAEEIARTLEHHLILRTSFRPSPWPYPTAYVDLYTSQDYLERLGPELALALQRWREIPYHTLHIATERKSAYELARRTRPDVRPASRQEAPVALPEDISLNTERWGKLKAEWGYA